MSMRDLKIFADNIEDKALQQINCLMDQPAFSNCKVRIMPDVHAGSGCVIGFTADLGDKVIPNVVGVDIGCGMLTVELGNVDINFEKLDSIIYDYIPSGFHVQDYDDPIVYHKYISTLRCKNRLVNTQRLQRSIGTLGGGNHFIEIDEDSNGNKYLIIHTGSRNLGKQVCNYYQKLAIVRLHGMNDYDERRDELIRVYKSMGRENLLSEDLKRLKEKYNQHDLGILKQLCYLEGKDREDYLHDMKICQEFAHMNRIFIADKICMEMFKKPLLYFPWFETVHNYIDHETNIVRKGAISAKKGEKLLIPLNMRDGCIVGVGKGNDDWNQSAPHGAGRIMSRMEARRNIALVDFENSMDGIHSSCINFSTIDESPMAYKPMEAIVDKISDTVDILEIIKPVYNFKASEV